MWQADAKRFHHPWQCPLCDQRASSFDSLIVMFMHTTQARDLAAWHADAEEYYSPRFMIIE